MDAALLKVIGGVLTASSVMLASPLMAADVTLSGDSTTILRMRTNTDDNSLYPAYEYLRLNVDSTLSDGASVAGRFGTWGRLDFADRSSARSVDNYSDGSIQYAYLSYRAAKSNAIVNVGRQFVNEGVAVDTIDGLYLRSDLLGGFGGAAFVGSKSLPTALRNHQQNEAFVYGARLTHSMPKYYTIGFSTLHSETDQADTSRRELGLDLWLHPFAQTDVTGRSSYNDLTGGWMEHSYTLSYTPVNRLRLSLDVSNANYRHLLSSVTTSALRKLDPNEEVTSVGIAAAYQTPVKNLNITATYKNYGYSIAGDANYYGAKATYAIPDIALTAGVGMHRMEGDSAKLRYTETRLYAGKKYGHVDLAIDFMNSWYDQAINGVHNSLTVLGSAGYEWSKKIKLGADLEFSKNPEFNSELRGMLKLSYAFDMNMKLGEGGDKREK